jgi:hypothetical protein
VLDNEPVSPVSTELLNPSLNSSGVILTQSRILVLPVSYRRPSPARSATRICHSSFGPLKLPAELAAFGAQPNARGKSIGWCTLLLGSLWRDNRSWPRVTEGGERAFTTCIGVDGYAWIVLKNSGFGPLARNNDSNGADALNR